VDQGNACTTRGITNGNSVWNLLLNLIYEYYLSQTSANGNITTSEIVYLPTPEDNNKVIACSVSTDELGMLSQTIKDTRILDIKRKLHINYTFPSLHINFNITSDVIAS
jgi:hypothetical protein